MIAFRFLLIISLTWIFMVNGDGNYFQDRFNDIDDYDEISASPTYGRVTKYVNNYAERVQQGDVNDVERVYKEKRSSSPFYVFRRGCVRRGGICDHRPNDCCFSSSCRCNLWGSNCRCQRMGLFQKLG